MTIQHIEVIYPTHINDDMSDEELLYQAWQQSGAYVNETFSDYKTRVLSLNDEA